MSVARCSPGAGALRHSRRARRLRPWDFARGASTYGLSIIAAIREPPVATAPASASHAEWEPLHPVVEIPRYEFGNADRPDRRESGVQLAKQHRHLLTSQRGA